MNEQINAIRNEIKRLEEIHERNLKKPMERGRIGFAHGVVECCDRILSFIDSLPESNCPKLSDTLEEAAETFNSEDAARMWDYEGKTQGEIVEAAFIAGANWQKEQMMKEAVAVEVVGEKRDLRLIDSTQRCLFNAERGDWLRVIIVKEDIK